MFQSSGVVFFKLFATRLNKTKHRFLSRESCVLSVYVDFEMLAQIINKYSICMYLFEI